MNISAANTPDLLVAGMDADMGYIMGAGILALLCVWSISRQLGGSNNWDKRIRSVQRRRNELKAEVNSPKKRKKPEASVNMMRNIAMKLQLVKKLQLEKAEAMLVHANFRSKDAIWVFAFCNLIAPILLGVLGFALMKMSVTDTRLKLIISYIWPVAGLYLGLNLPWMALRFIRRRRFIAIQRGLSDMLDLMTVCAEAGLSLAAALERVSRELGIVYPELAEEVSMTAIEIGFLPDRNKALHNLSERTGLKEVRGIVTVLIQTEKYGTPIAQALRVLSAEFRQQRMLRAEAKAARLPALMTLPMIVFVLPTLFIVIMTPAVLDAKKTMKSNNMQQGN